MDTNLHPVALDPDLLYLVLVLVRNWAKGNGSLTPEQDMQLEKDPPVDLLGQLL